MNKEYRTRCSSLQALNWESGLVPLPVEDANFWTFEPKIDDLALVDDKEYRFNGETWVEVQENGN